MLSKSVELDDHLEEFAPAQQGDAVLSSPEAVAAPIGSLPRPHVRGKFLFVGDRKLWVRGVTYGTFRPDQSGINYGEPAVVERDFAAMVANGVNAVRVYTVPPRWLLDMASAHNLWVMIGLPWEQHVAFLDDSARMRDITDRVRDAVRGCAAHPAVLCYAVGNEIPASVVRWHGARRIESFLAALCRVVRREDPGALVTYVNFPTSEYLDLPFVDFVSFNVYLETKTALSAYLARLQNIAGERPLMMAEVGLDSRSHGKDEQAATLRWQLATIFEAGCTGAFVFAWTDEWHRGGHDIDDWDFGLVTRERQPKPALAAVSDAFRDTPFSRFESWPRISVVVCSFNGAATIGETLTALERLDYDDYEIIVVDDGSTDATGKIAGGHRVRLIQTENRGLSNARNTGMHAATGDIIAYIDDDAYPDRDWLSFLAASFTRSDHSAIGGPNLAPPEDGMIADCVANAPGGPTHILLSDEIAEHIPGCNMAFRKDRLAAIDGFDPRFRVAGDDVDVCWRLQERGWSVGFSPSAVVWHHPRRSIRGYLKQQRGYAKAEALLADKWPAKYNSAGNTRWAGRIYGKGLIDTLQLGQRVYHGTWGTALFQSVYQPVPGLLSALPLMPEWYVLVAALAALCAVGLLWSPLLLLLPVLAFVLVVTGVQIVRGAARASFFTRSAPPQHLLMRLTVAGLYVLQPLARLLGRIQHRIGPWYSDGVTTHPIPSRFRHADWTEDWQAPEARLASLEKALKRTKQPVVEGGDFDRWDLTVIGGLFGSARALAMVEEHGAGRQLFRLRAWAKVPIAAIAVIGGLAVAAVIACYDGAWIAGLLLFCAALVLALRAYADCAAAMQCVRSAVGQLAAADGELPAESRGMDAG